MNEIVMWKVNTQWCRGIYPVSAQRVNDKSVWVDGRRTARTTTETYHFDTFDEARAFYLGRLSKQIERKAHLLSQLEKEAEKIRAVTEEDFEGEDDA